MSSEFDYLEYREQRQSFRGTFKHDRETLIINRDGTFEELAVEVLDNVYHSECLANRFSHLPIIDKYNEYEIACLACKYDDGIVFIIDSISVSIFLPSTVSAEQKETFYTIASKIDSKRMVFAGVVPKEGDLKAFNDGLVISVTELLDGFSTIPLSQPTKR